MRASVAVLAGLTLLGAAPAVAQIQQRPATSRSEAQTNAIAGSLQAQGQNRNAAQQNQFEINSLRTQNDMRATSPIVTAPPIVGPAPVR